MLAESAPWTAPQSLPFTTLNYREKSPTFLVLAQKNSGSSGLLWNRHWFWIASAVLCLTLQLWSIDILIHL